MFGGGSSNSRSSESIRFSTVSAASTFWMMMRCCRTTMGPRCRRGHCLRGPGAKGRPSACRPAVAFPKNHKPPPANRLLAKNNWKNKKRKETVGRLWAVVPVGTSWVRWWMETTWPLRRSFHLIASMRSQTRRIRRRLTRGGSCVIRGVVVIGHRCHRTVAGSSTKWSRQIKNKSTVAQVPRPFLSIPVTRKTQTDTALVAARASSTNQWKVR